MPRWWADGAFGVGAAAPLLLIVQPPILLRVVLTHGAVVKVPACALPDPTANANAWWSRPAPRRRTAVAAVHVLVAGNARAEGEARLRLAVAMVVILVRYLGQARK